MQIEIENRARKLNFGQMVLSWLINALGLLIVSKSIRGISFNGEGLNEVLLVLASAAVLGLINTALKPLLIVLTLPFNIVTLGLFTFVVNAACLGLVAYVVKGFEVAGFWPALWGALLLSLISMLLNAIVLIGGFKVKIHK